MLPDCSVIRPDAQGWYRFDATHAHLAPTFRNQGWRERNEIEAEEAKQRELASLTEPQRAVRLRPLSAREILGLAEHEHVRLRVVDGVLQCLGDRSEVLSEYLRAKRDETARCRRPKNGSRFRKWQR